MNRNGIDDVDKSAQVCLVNMEPVFESDVHITWNVCSLLSKGQLQATEISSSLLPSSVFIFFSLFSIDIFLGLSQIMASKNFFMILMIFKWSYQLINFYNYPLISFKKSRRLFPPFFLISCNVHRLSQISIVQVLCICLQGLIHHVIRGQNPDSQCKCPRNCSSFNLFGFFSLVFLFFSKYHHFLTRPKRMYVIQGAVRTAICLQKMHIT